MVWIGECKSISRWVLNGIKCTNRSRQISCSSGFVVLERGEDIYVPIILGRPFLATVRATIDMNNGKLTFKIGKEKVEFNDFQLIDQTPIHWRHGYVCKRDIKQEISREFTWNMHHTWNYNKGWEMFSSPRWIGRIQIQCLQKCRELQGRN